MIVNEIEEGGEGVQPNANGVEFWEELRIQDAVSETYSEKMFESQEKV